MDVFPEQRTYVEGRSATGESALDRSPTMQRSRQRSLKQVQVILDTAARLVREKGDEFTTQELAKEAGVGLQTVYRFFATKDELLLAVLGDMIAATCARNAAATRGIQDPIARLKLYITSAIDSLDGGGDNAAAARFVVSAHWNLQRSHPNQIADATKPFADLLLTEIKAGVAAGRLSPIDPEGTAWFLNALVRSVYHHYAYASDRPASIREDLWQFCLRALGGTE